MKKKCKHKWSGLNFKVYPKLLCLKSGLVLDYNNADEVSTYGCHKCGATMTKNYKRKGDKLR